jgi:VWFA-related protein
MIRVNTTLVAVPAVVSDEDGRLVTDLKATDFHLYENGTEERIDRVIPEAGLFNVALMLDTSGSTVFKHADIRMAALAFAEQLRPDDRLMVLSFGNMILVNSELTNDRHQILRAILDTKGMGGTRLYDAVDLLVTERLDRIPGRKAIVLFTDGVDTASRLATEASTVARIEESEAIVYVIQYETMRDRPAGVPLGAMLGAAYVRGTEYLRNLAGHSGGQVFNAASVSNLQEAFARIAEELRHQYTICYYPSNTANDGSFRRIRVAVDKPNVRVRARTGYRPDAKVTSR